MDSTNEIREYNIATSVEQLQVLLWEEFVQCSITDPSKDSMVHVKGTQHSEGGHSNLVAGGFLLK